MPTLYPFLLMTHRYGTSFYFTHMDVGVRVSTAIRNYKEHRNAPPVSDERDGEPGSHASPRPHIRSAHWQTYWIGPRDAVFPERKPVLRWIPPIPVGMDWKRELPTTVRRVGA